MNLRETYNKIAAEWHKDHQGDDWWVAGTDTFISNLKPASLVLDVGCGGGTKSAYLLGKGLNVVGIDFAENLIEIAKREAPTAEFHAMDMHDVRELPQNFDGIFAQASLLHIPKNEVLDVLRGLVERLSSGGYLYVAVKGKRADGPDEEVKQEDDYGYPYERFFSYYSLDELAAHFKTLGLEVVYTDVHKTGKSDWIQIIGKKY